MGTESQGRLEAYVRARWTRQQGGIILVPIVGWLGSDRVAEGVRDGLGLPPAAEESIGGEHDLHDDLAHVDVGRGVEEHHLGDPLRDAHPVGVVGDGLVYGTITSATCWLTSAPDVGRVTASPTMLETRTPGTA